MRLPCAVCSTEFVPYRPFAKYCSTICASEARRRRDHGYHKTHYIANKAKKAKAHRAYIATTRGREAKRLGDAAYRARWPILVAARIRAYCKTEAGKAMVQKKNQRQRKKFPEKVRARTAVRGALIAGRLLRSPCQRCGASKAHAHHHDYSKPLDVEWLCPSCHKTEHQKVAAE